MLAFLCMLAVIPALLLLRSHANHSALGAAMWCGSVLIVAPVVGLSARRRRVAVFESGLLLGRMFVAREELQGWSLYDGMLDVLVRHRIEPQRMDGWYHTVRFARGDEVLLEEALRRAFPAAAPKRP